MNESWEWFLNSQIINEILKVKGNKISECTDSWTQLKIHKKITQLKIAGFNKDWDKMQKWNKVILLK